MATVCVTTTASAEDVFAVLEDPNTYPDWLIGCKDIRSVDDRWPAPDSRFHHRVGLVGPVTVKDSTRVLDVARPTRLELEVRARPMGRGVVTFVLTEEVEQTRLEMRERPLGLLRLAAPALAPLVVARNRRSANALVDLAERRAPTGGRRRPPARRR